MPEKVFPYPESILQWVWSSLLFSTHELYTICNKRVSVINQGTLNRSNGPDFLHADILIDKVRWAGAVELHLHSSAWNEHGHHKDPNYNQVVLHIVLDSQPVPVFTENGSRPYVLNLLPHIDKKLHSFVREFYRTEALPCSSNVHFINSSVFAQQVEKAHKEYFDKKTEDFFQFYNPNELLSSAWKNALIISLFDGLGISHNRNQMIELGKSVVNYPFISLKDLQKHVSNFAFGPSSELAWNLKSSRPFNHPKKRITQACHLLYLIRQEPLDTFIQPNYPFVWNRFAKSLQVNNSDLFKILYATVFLPAIYALGALLSHHHLQQKVLEEWQLLKRPIPKKFVQPFSETIEEAPALSKKLGLVHQFNHYCNQKRCTECMVLKKVIQG